jgi:hypothetical protein
VKQTTAADLVGAAEWLWGELRRYVLALREPALWAALAVGALVWALAYQAGSSYTIAVGGDQVSRLRHYDAPFLEGFNASEPDGGEVDWADIGTRPYRWAEDRAAITLPAVGAGDWRVRVWAASGRPDQSSIATRWSAGSGPPQTLTVAAQPRVYELLGSTAEGDLKISIASPLLEAPGDPRRLGVVISQVSVAHVGGLLLPAPGQIGLQALALAALYALARRLGAGQRPAGALTLTGGVAAAWLLATNRLGLTVATPMLAALALALLPLGSILLALVRRGARAAGLQAASWEIGAAVGIVLAGFAVRVAGVLHPYARFSDLGFHVHNLQRLAGGQVFLLAGLPCEAGAGQAPYPPALSLVLAPAALVAGIGDPAVATLLLTGTALLEIGAAACIWLLLRASGCRAALVGSALYCVATPLLGSYSVGEISNVFAQVWLAPLLVVLAQWPASHARRQAVAVGALAGALFLSHTGVTLSTLALLAAWFAVRIGRDHRLPVGALVRRYAAPALAVAAAGLAALLLFYLAYAYLPAANRANAAALATRTPAVICPPGYPLGEKLARTIGLGLGAGGSLALPLVIAGAAGAWLARRTGLGALLAAAGLGAVLSFATLLSSDQPVRWAHFLFPALCVGAGLCFAHWLRRGRAGATLAAAAGAWVVWYGLAQWVEQIARYMH